MRAVRIETLDGPRSVVVGEMVAPIPSPTQLLVEVHAAPVVFPDLLMTRGEYQLKPELPFVPGGVAAGVVCATPPDCGFAVGDRVVAMTSRGSWAEVVAAETAVTFAMPVGCTFEQAAALPINYTTMYFALRRRGRLTAGETVLVHGAAGGIGTASVQLAAALGAHVIAVVSSATKAETARQAGAHEVVEAEGFAAAVRELTKGRGVDVVVDPVGGDRFTDSLRCLAPEGRLLVIGFAAGTIPTVKVNRLLLNNIDVVGVGWGEFWSRNPGYMSVVWGELTALVEDGGLEPIIGETFPLDRAADALTMMAARGAVANLVLTVR